MTKMTTGFIATFAINQMELLSGYQKYAKDPGAKSTQIWFTGDVMSGFVSKAKSMHVMVQKDVLQYPHFDPKDT